MRTRAATALGAMRSGVARRLPGRPRLPTRGQAGTVALVAPLVLLVAGGASAPPHVDARSDPGITPLAAVIGTADSSDAEVVAAKRPVRPFRVATTDALVPPPIVLSSVGSLRIPTIALSAYRNAERMMAAAYPACGVSWNLLAGIGRIESMHAGGGTTDAHGTSLSPIYGPTLDGTLDGNEVVVSSVRDGRVTYARALGPMQFLPGTWARYASDGDGDGTADVQNLYDSTLGAARYLCSGGLNLRDPAQVMSAILRYNNSVPYARNVLGWAAAYATGVEPVDLPLLTGPAPPLGDQHLDATPEGLGPGLPLSAAGLPVDDPLAIVPLLGPGRPEPAAELGAPALGQGRGPLPGPASPTQNCAVFCLTPPPATPETTQVGSGLQPASPAGPPASGNGNLPTGIAGPSFPAGGTSPALVPLGPAPGPPPA